MNINELGERIDIHKAARLIALSLGRDEPVANKTVYAWIKRGHFPAPLKTPNGAAVWETKACLKQLGLKAV